MSSHAALFNLSLTTLTDEKAESRVGALPEAMRMEVERLQRERQQVATTAAAEQVVGLMGEVDTSNERDATQIRAYRQYIKETKTGMDRRDLCLAYGLETQNFVPLLVELGHGYDYRSHMTSDEFDKLANAMPDDWTPTADDNDEG